MTPADLDALRAEVATLARRAGDAILAVYESDFAVARKDDASPLTEADLASHRIIAQGLHGLTPELPVLSEESATVPWSERSRWRRYWLVDPLDGTREFVKRNGEFTVNIALIEDGRPILGVVHTPVRQQLVHAARDAGAIAERPDTAPTPISVGPCRMESPRVAGSRSHRDPRMDAFLQRMGEHELVVLGSSLKFCMLAEHAVDVYLRLGSTSEWDTAAGQCVVECAGGRVTDLALAPLRYNTRDSLINPDFLAVGDTTVDWRKYL